MVETSAAEVKPRERKTYTRNYDPHATIEQKVDIPFLHPVDVPQVIHDTKVVTVPQTVIQEKIVRVPQPVYQEKIVKVSEKPTNIHHIDLTKEQTAAVSFAEASTESSWPWWWWLPLLLLCCCLPL